MRSTVQAGKVVLGMLLAAAATMASAQGRATTTSLQLAANGRSVQVHVAGSNPTGVVTLLGTRSAVSRELGSVALDSDGNGTLPLASETAGATLTAVYRGDAANGSSRSAETQFTPQSGSSTSDFGIALSSTSYSVVAGGYATVTVTVTPTNSFSQTVALYCNGLPDNTTCAFTPTSVQTAGVTTATSTLQILTTSPSGKYAENRTRRVVMAGGFVLAALLLAGGLRRRSLRLAGIAAMALFLGVGISGCNARYDYLNHAPSPAGTGTPAGTYNLTISGSSDDGITSTIHSVAATLTVTNS